MTIKGLDKLIRKLDSLGGNSKKALKTGIRKATKHVQGDAKELAPVAEIDGGRLRNSIQGEVKEIDGKTVGVVSTNVEYAAYVEFGTGVWGEDSPSPPKYPGQLNYRQDWDGMEAQPYLYPALVQNKDNIKEIVRDELKEEIRKVARR